MIHVSQPYLVSLSFYTIPIINSQDFSYSSDMQRYCSMQRTTLKCSNFTARDLHKLRDMSAGKRIYTSLGYPLLEAENSSAYTATAKDVRIWIFTKPTHTTIHRDKRRAVFRSPLVPQPSLPAGPPDREPKWSKPNAFCSKASLSATRPHPLLAT